MTEKQILKCPECGHRISIPADSIEPSKPQCEEHGSMVHFFRPVGDE